jgi:hypothetical protein
MNNVCSSNVRLRNTPPICFDTKHRSRINSSKAHLKNSQVLIRSSQRQLGCTTPPPPEGSYWTRATPAVGHWGPSTDSAPGPAIASDRRPEFELEATHRPGSCHRHRAHSTGPGAGRPGPGGAAIAGTTAGRPREPPAKKWADPARAAYTKPLLANVYTYTKRTSPHPVDPGGTAVSSTATAGGRRWRSDDSGRPQPRTDHPV